MSARHKLNAANLHGAIFIAGLLFVFTGSPAVFVIALGVLIATALHDGGIRPGRR